jgi:D-glycero-beta-D-manno-heptose-7-phosphate kinase|tara:strand:- start:410 stop:1309 length:900 start_codon:yes stop_codon:yes gene_type:complete
MNLDFSNITILLVGDLMIDHYIIGTSNRVSPEAPVPVVIPKEEYSIPGGAANVAMNLCAMGANVVCLGTVGDDIWGEKLISILKNKGINVDSIDIIQNHPTTLKQRIYSDGKQVARLDTEKILEWNPKMSDHNLDNYDACILSDYNKGVVNNIELDAKILIVDPKKDNFSEYSNANIITPNLSELQRTTNIELKNDQSIVDTCNDLIAKHNFDYIVAKKGDQGMIIVGQRNFVKHIRAHPVKNADVTGAGDTVIAVLSVVYAKTKDIELSAKIANTAAAIAVGKPGTATVTIDEINNYI